MAKEKTNFNIEGLLDGAKEVTDKIGTTLLDTIVPGGDEASKNNRLLQMALILNENRRPGVAPATKYLEALNVGQGSGDIDAAIKQLRYQKLLKDVQGDNGGVPAVRRPITDDIIDKDQLAEYAFGPADALMYGVGGVGRIFDIDLFSDQSKARANLSALNKEILRTAASEVSGRPSVYYLQLSADEIPTPAGLTSDISEMRKYEALLNRFEGQLTKNIDLLKVAENQGDKARISKVSRAIADQDYIVRRLRGVVRALQDETGQGVEYDTNFDMSTTEQDSVTLDDFLKDDF